MGRVETERPGKQKVHVKVSMSKRPLNTPVFRGKWGSYIMYIAARI